MTEQLTALDDEFRAATAELTQRLDPRSETFVRVTLVPKKSDITVRVVGVGWVPVT